MSSKTMVMLSMVAGSYIGGYVTTLFGASWLSLWSVLGNAVGGLIGIWLGYTFFV